MNVKRTGFTLVEVLVATTIGAFIASIAVGSLKVISTSAEIVDENIKTASEVRFASNMLRRDITNLYRDSDIRNMKFVGMVLESGERTASVLTFYTIGRTKARISQPEGDMYEVEYYLLKDGDESYLMRRLWPNPDPNQAEPGGILTVIAEDIDIFEVRYFDGQDWSDEWPEEIQTLPELVEVSIAAIRPERRGSAVESFMVNFARFTPGEGPSGEGRGAEDSEGRGDRGPEEDSGRGETEEMSGNEGERNR